MDKLTLKEEKFDHDLQSPVDQVFYYFFYIEIFFLKKRVKLEKFDHGLQTPADQVFLLFLLN